MLKKDAKERKGRGKHLEFQARCCDVCDEFEECECACAAMTRAHLPNLPLTRQGETGGVRRGVFTSSVRSWYSQRQQWPPALFRPSSDWYLILQRTPSRTRCPWMRRWADFTSVVTRITIVVELNTRVVQVIRIVCVTLKTVHVTMPVQVATNTGKVVVPPQKTEKVVVTVFMMEKVAVVHFKNK